MASLTVGDPSVLRIYLWVAIFLTNCRFKGHHHSSESLCLICYAMSEVSCALEPLYSHLFAPLIQAMLIGILGSQIAMICCHHASGKYIIGFFFIRILMAISAATWGCMVCIQISDGLIKPTVSTCNSLLSSFPPCVWFPSLFMHGSLISPHAATCKMARWCKRQQLTTPPPHALTLTESCESSPVPQTVKLNSWKAKFELHHDASTKTLEEVLSELKCLITHRSSLITHQN
jgi:hypothetical protein